MTAAAGVGFYVLIIWVGLIMKLFSYFVLTLSVFVLVGFFHQVSIASDLAIEETHTKAPNIILIFLDDAGYGDLGYTGASTPTPNIDRLAESGAKLNHFYVAQAACSSSRAALLTGMYPNRFDFPWVLSPKSKVGLRSEDITLAEFLKTKGYRTAMYGKWHLGSQKGALPTSHGFDEYVGIPYSGDMTKYNVNSNAYKKHQKDNSIKSHLPLVLYEGTELLIADVMPKDQKLFTKTFTDRAINVIESDLKEPFFIYLPYNQPHVMLYVSDEFEGKSGKGLYGDVMTEIDHSVGRIMSALEKKGIRENTLVIFTSDNGPWRVFGNHGGSTGPFREEKGTNFEGGSHVFGVINWPARIKPGTEVNEPAMTVDIYKTLATLLGDNTANKSLDGRNILPFLEGKQEKSDEPFAYYFYRKRRLEGMRYGQWKFYFPHSYRHAKTLGDDGIAGSYIAHKTDYALYNVYDDPGETKDLAKEYPKVVAKLKKMGETFEGDLAAHRGKPGQYGK